MHTRVEHPRPAEPSESLGRILTILHQAHSTPGRIGRLLEARGYTLDPRRPALGDALPEHLDDHAGVVIFGGPMSVNDPLPWLKTELDFVGKVIEQDAPLLGVCLGAQLMAKQLGAKVSRHTEGLSEIGYYPLSPTELGADLLPWPSHVYHWHSEGFELPEGADLLATGEVFPNQAFRYGRHGFAVQFHPEVTHEMMCRWTTKAADKLKQPGAQPGPAHLDGWYRHDPAVCHWLERFLDGWLDLTVEDPV
ncbi:GMP synthase [Azorhizobium oxalatiphilum]|uniref:GMP synthase n=1 Tax=Azorhizobium oxalatiphilum TaxID=980631 RepID=A0A917C1Y1_9HYPH|nr:glutamine amidotransferase [Azorhizobium oxalatiphilum]GGF64894.1 GMP synthase [Azorhizobium oxalatiphilum]